MSESSLPYLHMPVAVSTCQQNVMSSELSSACNGPKTVLFPSQTTSDAELHPASDGLCFAFCARNELLNKAKLWKATGANPGHSWTSPAKCSFLSFMFFPQNLHSRGTLKLKEVGVAIEAGPFHEIGMSPPTTERKHPWSSHSPQVLKWKSHPAPKWKWVTV